MRWNSMLKIEATIFSFAITNSCGDYESCNLLPLSFVRLKKLYCLLKLHFTILVMFIYMEPINIFCEFFTMGLYCDSILQIEERDWCL